MTTDNIEVSVAGEGWLTVIDEEITFELLVLEGVEAVFGTAELPAGKYTQVRLSVPEVQIEKDGELITAEVPSDTIKLVGNFELADGQTTFISLDFEVDKSLVDRQRQGFLFKPVIKPAVGEPGERGSRTVVLPGKLETVAETAVPVPTGVPVLAVHPAAATLAAEAARSNPLHFLGTNRTPVALTPPVCCLTDNATNPLPDHCGGITNHLEMAYRISISRSWRHHKPYRLEPIPAQ